MRDPCVCMLEREDKRKVQQNVIMVVHSKHKSGHAMSLGPVGVYQAFCQCLSTDYRLYMSLGIPDYV